MPSFLNIDVFKHLGSESDIGRGRLFEKPFMYAVYARYLLELWMDVKKPWVSLAKVFEGAVHPGQVLIFERYEVNLYGGLVTNIPVGSHEHAAKRTLSYLRSKNHHDAYIWCREKGIPKEAAEFAVPLQLRNVGANLCKTKTKSAKVRLLLSVNPNKTTIVIINADGMITISKKSAVLEGQLFDDEDDEMKRTSSARDERKSKRTIVAKKFSVSQKPF